MKNEIQYQEDLLFEGLDDDDHPIELTQDKRRVYSDKSDKSIYELFRQYSEGDLILDPDFQRGYVWDDKKASLLIESVLLEIPIPTIYLAEEEDGKFVVIDGQQRLRSFFMFLDNKFKLKGLSVLSELNGKSFKILSKNIQRKLQNATLRIIEIRKESNPDVKFEIFERLNVGSVKLNDQELRNCIYRGEYNDLIKELAETKDFLFLLGLKEPHKRMYDKELVLHFLAFHNQTYIKYKPPMKQFLNKEMESKRNISKEEIKKLRQTFKETVSSVKSVFGEKAFRRFIRGNSEDPNGKWETRKINVGLFEIVMCGFAQYPKSQIISNGDAIREALISLMASDDEFIDSISGSGTHIPIKVRARFKKWTDALEKIIGNTKKEQRLFSWQLKKELFEQNPVCAICKNKIMTIDDAALDHNFPYSKGGKTKPSNAQLTHRYCNLRKGAKIK